MLVAGLALLSASAGEAALHTQPSQLYFTVFTPRGGTEIGWIDPAMSPATPRILRSLVGAASVSWSPDGRRLAFVSPLGLSVANADGTNQRRLIGERPNSFVRDADPAWSPDGDEIAFTHFSGALTAHIEVISATGSGRRVVTRGQEPSWSPDGRRIVFDDGGSGRWRLFTVDATGKHRQQLTQPDGTDGAPAWSPDGRTIVFMREQDHRPAIYRIGANGKDLKRLTDGFDTTPGWSPDGQFVVFSRRQRNGRFQLFSVRADGAAPVQLTRGPMSVEAPHWRPRSHG